MCKNLNVKGFKIEFESWITKQLFDMFEQNFFMFIWRCLIIQQAPALNADIKKNFELNKIYF